MLKEILNEYEADWAAMPAVEKEKLNMLKGKTVAVCGYEIARMFCYALLYLNETKGLGVNVILLGKTRQALSDYHPDLIMRNDFDFVDYNSVSEIKKADYLLCTGLCSEEIEDGARAFSQTLELAKAAAQLAENTKARVVLLSDSRVYGNGESHRVYSENEYAKAMCDSADFDVQLMRTLETMWSCCAKKGGFELSVLRTGIVLAASSNIKTDFDEIIYGTAEGKKCQIFNSTQKFSFVYINDVFRAIVYAFTTLESNETYNVTGISSNASSGAVVAMLHDIYGERADIELCGNHKIRANAINANKIALRGCAPTISLETAFELCVMSKSSGNALRLPHSHDGRLSSIQQVLLAYLLEVDRICRKHNIKYFLGGGTLLGAIRHHGFIPWDDDADIMMLREDYDKFCEVAPLEMPPSMTFQTNESDKNCFYEFAKFRLNNTVFATGFAKEHKDMHNGLAFDIFCHDKTANSKLGQKLHLNMTLFARALVFNKWNNRKAENSSRLQSAVTNFCKRIFPLHFSLWLEKKTLAFFKNKRNAKFLYDGMGRNIYNGSFPAEYLDEVIYVDFEGFKLPVPKEYDKYLTFLYGDYMELAPVSTRLGCHEIELCDIGKYDCFKLKNDK